MQLSKLTARARSAATMLACVSLVACAAAFAQSGRRPPKQQDIPPVPTPTPEPTPIPRVATVAEKIPLLVLADNSLFFHQTSREMDTVEAVVVTRLRESGALEVSGERRRASRGEAIKRAKEMRGPHVVWIELRTDSGQEMRTQRLPPEYFSIYFTVYQPGTGKLKSSGVIPLRRTLGPLGRARLPSCYPVSTYDVEFALGALEAAEHIMESFSLPIPPHCR